MSEKKETKKSTTTKTVKKDTVKKVEKKAVEKATKPIVAKIQKETIKSTKKFKKLETKKTDINSKTKTSKKNTNTIYATGKRKNAIAKVWLNNGTGKIIVNGKPATEYLKRAILDVIVNQPFAKTGTEGRFDINCTVLGGGLSGQAGAIKHAISIALQLLNPELRTVLKSAGFLTRDSRVVERKKAGLKKARKGQVYQRR